MTKPHNVDICVTCVSDKPPQLPLREELPSLGIEVVYNAQGVGAKASKHESKKLLKKYREAEMHKGKTNHTMQEEREMEEDLMIPRALSYQSYQKELYHVQKKSTESHSSSSSSSSNSWETNSTLDSSDVENKNLEPMGQKHLGSTSPSVDKVRGKPPKTVEIPRETPEDIAIREAFRIFSDPTENIQRQVDESRDASGTLNTPSSGTSPKSKGSEGSRHPSSPGNCSRQTPSSGTGSSTLFSQLNEQNIQEQGRIAASGGSLPSGSSTAKNNSCDLLSSEPTNHTHGYSTLSSDRDDVQKQKVQIHSSPAIRDKFPNLRFGDSSSTSSEDENSTSQISSLKGSAHSSGVREKTASPSSPTIKIMQITSPNNETQASELFDLTEISDDDSIFGDAEKYGDAQKFLFDTESTSKHSGLHSKDLSTLSSKNDPSPDFRNRPLDVHVFPSKEIQRQLPGLRLTIPEVDDGYGHIVLDLSSVCEEDGQLSLVPSPNSFVDSQKEKSTSKGKGKRVIHSPHKRQIDYSEDRQDYEIMESPTTPTRNTSHNRHDYRDDSERAPIESRRDEYDGHVFSLIDDTSSNNSRSTDNTHDVIHSPQKSRSPDSTDNDHGRKERPNIPTLMSASGLSKKAKRVAAKETAPLSPSLKNYEAKDISMHGSPNMHVSFSQDVEERYYSKDEEYRQSFDAQARKFAADHGMPEMTTYEERFNLDEQRDIYDDDIPVIQRDLSADAEKTFDSFLKSTESVKATRSDKGRLESERQSRAADGSKMQQGLQEMRTKSTFKRDSNSAAEATFLNALSNDSPLPKDFVEILERNPDLARNKLPEADVYPLHAACTRIFPNRFRDNQSCHVVDLVADVVERRNLIASLVEADPSRCICLNRDGDLPVHLLARRLMEWEAKWYQKVYEKAREDGENELESGVGITRLYQTMSKSIDLLLKPVSSDALLCQRPGSIGRLLPLHIAAIFTVSYDTLKALLEVFEEGAHTKCNLDSIRTFIPSNATPLELHDRLSTDFPKWEIEGMENEEDINWTQSALDKSYGTKGSMRRSDLMFAFNPYMLPYRSDKSRIRRLESRIRHEIGELEGDNKFELSRAVRLLWAWICTFEGFESADDQYVESVERIVQSISCRAVKSLASLSTDDGKTVFDKAIPPVVAIIRDRLSKLSETEIPIPTAALSSGFLPDQHSFLMRQWEYDNASRFCLQGRGFIGPLCRTLFNITESNFPTSFVLLPYKLIKDKDGRLGLESAEAANVAMQFADCLLHLTDPKVLLHFMEKKSVRFLGKRLKKDDETAWALAEAKAKELTGKLLKLYTKGPAYLYYLDEFNGVPIVSEDNGLYPLVVADSADMIRKVLPLMLTGMALMRGEKAISVLTRVLLDPDLECVQSHWIDAAKDILGYMYSSQTEWSSGFLQDLFPLRAKLVDFVERGPSDDGAKPDRNGLASEWVVEISLVKMVVQMHDSNHTYAGVKPKRSGPLKVLWTKEWDFLNPDNKDHLFYIDFKSTSDLKELSSDDRDEAMDARRKQKEMRMSSYDAGRSSPDSTSNEKVPGYALLFQELSLLPSESNSKIEETEKDQNEAKEDLWKQREGMETMLAMKSIEQVSSADRPISLLDFDDDLDLDSVLKLRILLDEQEAKLDFLKDKVSDLEVEEKELLEREERLSRMLGEINNAKDNLLLSNPTNQGLTRARNLLHRICELEDRVLCREVEVGQLKNEIVCFDLEAAAEGNDSIFLFDD